MTKKNKWISISLSLLIILGLILMPIFIFFDFGDKSLPTTPLIPEISHPMVPDETDYEIGGKIVNFDYFTFFLEDPIQIQNRILHPTMYFWFDYYHFDKFEFVDLNYRVIEINTNNIFQDWIYWGSLSETTNEKQWFWVDHLKVGDTYIVQLMINENINSIVSSSSFTIFAAPGSGWKGGGAIGAFESVNCFLFLSLNLPLLESEVSFFLREPYEGHIFLNEEDKEWIPNDLKNNSHLWTEKHPTMIEKITFYNLKPHTEYSLLITKRTIHPILVEPQFSTTTLFFGTL